MFVLPTRPYPSPQPLQDIPRPTLRPTPNCRPIRPASAFPPYGAGRRLSLDSVISLDSWPLPSTSHADRQRRSLDSFSSFEPRPSPTALDPPPYLPRRPANAAMVELEARQVQEAINRSLRPDDRTDSMHFDDPPSYTDVEQLPQRRGKKKRRLLFLGILLTILFLAGILGAVFGSRLQHSGGSSSNDNDSGPGDTKIDDLWSGGSKPLQQTLPHSGIATLLMNPNNYFLYYFAPNGSIMELALSTSSASSNLSYGRAEIAVAAPQAAPNSPLAVTLTQYHQPYGTTQRRLFYISNSNAIMTTSASSQVLNSVWSPPRNISGLDTAVPGSKALAACSSIQPRSGVGGNTTDIRVYYGSSETSNVRELKATSDYGYTPFWNTSADFSSSSPTAGVACVGSRLYLQDDDATHPHVRQHTWDSGTLSWIADWWSPPSPSLAENTSITAAGYDVFYQWANGTVARMSLNATKVRMSASGDSYEVEGVGGSGLAAQNATMAALTRDGLHESLLLFTSVNNEKVVDYAAVS